MTDSREIWWVSSPDFGLYCDDQMYDKVICTRRGLARLVEPGGDYLEVDFPEGWVSDVTSSPLAFRMLVPQLGPHAPAAILHDRLLNTGFARGDARRWMWVCLSGLHQAHWLRRFAMYAGVLCWDVLVAVKGWFKSR